MARVSPLRRMHQEAEASLLHYGPADKDVQLVETFGEMELEYGALRKGCILLDEPNRGTIVATGADRVSFLNRMVTQELKDLTPFRSVCSFWLSRKGRIDADLRIIELPDRTLLDMDVHSAAGAMAGLSAFIVADDVTLTDATEQMHRLALHGPTGPALLEAISTPVDGPRVGALLPGQACIVSIVGRDVVVDRDDPTGDPGLELHLRVEDALPVYQQLIEAGAPHEPDDPSGADLTSRIRLRPSGWHAFNMARIEGGRPMYRLDFGPDSLPHETGILRERVSFTKGCYLGQEIVARMESRGQSRARLCALRLDPGDQGAPVQPVTGAQVFDRGDPGGEVIGLVTSSAISPMLGGVAVCFAMVRSDRANPGAELLVSAEGALCVGRVQDGLTLWSRGR